MTRTADAVISDVDVLADDLGDLWVNEPGSAWPLPPMRSTALPGICAENIPAEMRQAPRWVAWQGRKVPVHGVTHRAITWTDPGAWSTFAATHARAVNGYGMGFVLGGGRLGIDLDHVRDPETGVLTSEAQRIIGLADSYAEVSPSGTGVHIILTGDPLPNGAANSADLPGGGRIEMYDAGRYFTVTGRRLYGEHVRKIRAGTAALHALLFPEHTAKAATTDGDSLIHAHDDGTPVPPGEQDNYLAARAMAYARAGGMGRAAMIGALLGEAATWTLNGRPFTRADIEPKVDSALRKVAADPPPGVVRDDAWRAANGRTDADVSPVLPDADPDDLVDPLAIEMCREMMTRLAKPAGMIMVPQLGTWGIAIGDRRDVATDAPHVHPIPGYAVIIVRSGIAKTEVLKELMAPIAAVNRNRHADLTAYRKAVKDHKASKDTGPEPERPAGMLYRSNASPPEAFLKALQYGGMSIYCPELGAWVEGQDKWSKGASTDPYTFAMLWDGEDYYDDRMTREPINLIQPRAGILGAIPEDKLAIFGRLEGGLRQRFEVFYGLDIDKVTTGIPFDSNLATRYAWRMDSLLKIPHGGKPAPALVMGRETLRVFEAGMRRCDGLMTRETEAVWSKIPSLAARIAGRIALFSEPGTMQVRPHILEAAFRYGDFLAAHNLAASAKPTARLATVPGEDWLRARGGVPFARRDMVRAGAGGCRDNATADRVIAGWAAAGMATSQSERMTGGERVTVTPL
jgi:hypothetical protein